MFTIWIGYDSQFQSNISPLLESIRKYSNNRFTIKFLHLDKLSNILYRDRDPKQSTDSAFTRWLVPYLANYQGWHLYMDSDMMVRRSLDQLDNLIDDDKAVMVVKHSDQHAQTVKFNGHVQTAYNRKNWSSLMLFNADRCRALTLDYVNKASGLDLHQFKWTHETLIGELPLEWNWLVGEYPYKEEIYNIHFTEGGPYFKEYKNTKYANEWFKVYNNMTQINL
jgi:hypothetical protein